MNIITGLARKTIAEIGREESASRVADGQTHERLRVVLESIGLAMEFESDSGKQSPVLPEGKWLYGRVTAPDSRDEKGVKPALAGWAASAGF